MAPDVQEASTTNTLFTTHKHEKNVGLGSKRAKYPCQSHHNSQYGNQGRKAQNPPARGGKVELVGASRLGAFFIVEGENNSVSGHWLGGVSKDAPTAAAFLNSQAYVPHHFAQLPYLAQEEREASSGSCLGQANKTTLLRRSNRDDFEAVGATSVPGVISIWAADIGRRLVA